MRTPIRTDLNCLPWNQVLRNLQVTGIYDLQCLEEGPGHQLMSEYETMDSCSSNSPYFSHGVWWCYWCDLGMHLALAAAKGWKPNGISFCSHLLWEIYYTMKNNRWKQDLHLKSIVSVIPSRGYTMVKDIFKPRSEPSLKLRPCYLRLNVLFFMHPPMLEGNRRQCP